MCRWKRFLQTGHWKQGWAFSLSFLAAAVSLVEGGDVEEGDTGKGASRGGEGEKADCLNCKSSVEYMSAGDFFSDGCGRELALPRVLLWRLRSIDPFWQAMDSGEVEEEDGEELADLLA